MIKRNLFSGVFIPVFLIMCMSCCTLSFFQNGNSKKEDGKKDTPKTDPVEDPYEEPVKETVVEDVIKISIQEGTDLSGVAEKKYQFRINGITLLAGDTFSFDFIPCEKTQSVCFRGVSSNEKYFDKTVLPASDGESASGVNSENVITKEGDWYSASIKVVNDTTDVGFTFYLPSVPDGSEIVHIKNLKINGSLLVKGAFDSGDFAVADYYSYPPGIKSEFYEITKEVIKTKKICAAYIATWGVYDPKKGKSRSWTADDILGNQITDLILSFATLSDSDHVTLETDEVDDYKEEIAILNSRYPGLRIDIAIGGGSEGIADFKAMAADVSLRKKFVQNVKDYLLENPGIHGVDIDWEYPGKSGSKEEKQADIENYICLMNELKSMLNDLGKAKGVDYRLTTALPPDRQNLIDNIVAIQDACDGLNLMMYDCAGAWSENTGHNSPMDEIEYSVNKYLSAGVPGSKIILGIPFYGQKWTGVEAGTSHGLGMPVTPYANGDDYGIQYPKIVELMKSSSYVRYWDEVACAPYLYNKSAKIFISYTDEEQIDYFSKLARESELGGLMTWEYGQDMSFTLIKAIKSGLNY